MTDPLNHTTEITEYDSTETFPLNTENALGHVTTTEYDAGFGKLEYVIPPHLQDLQDTIYLIENEYDQFGRIKKQTRADEGYTEYSYEITGVPGANHWVDTIEHIEGGPSPLVTRQRVYFDGLGRTWQTNTWAVSYTHLRAHET